MKNLLLLTLCVSILSACSTKSNDYGTKLDIGGDQLFYKPPVTEANALEVGNFLKSYQYFKGSGSAVQVLKETNYVVRFATRPGTETDNELIKGYIFIQLDMSNTTFDGQPVDIELCDSILQTKKRINFDEAKSVLEDMIIN
ncbi:MAG: hypothetical protein WBP43_11140 [Chitinophagales bacterium]